MINTDEAMATRARVTRGSPRRAFFARGAAIFGVLGGAAGSPWSRSASAAETYTMRISTPTAATSAISLVALRFAAAIRRRSNGQINVEVYPNGQLAQQQETIDALTN